MGSSILFYFGIISISINLIVGTVEEQYLKKSTEKSLLLELMKRYEIAGVSGRPVNNSRKTVKIYYGLALVQILGLDENTQILRTNCWGRYKWHDELLSWNPDDYDGIDQIRLNRKYLWIPDIVLFNFADERMKVHREARVVVGSNGNTLWIPQALFKSSCSVEIIYFPFDVQICRLDFGSWTYDITQLELHWWTIDDTGYPNDSTPYVDFKDYILSNEWLTDGEGEKDTPHTKRVKQIKSQRYLRQQNITDGDKILTKSFHILRYRIRLRRNPSFYIFILIIPCVLLSVLVNIVFWLPPESPAKLLLGMNIFVSFFVLLLLLKSSIPTAVRSFPLIGSFFCLNMIMITVSTFLVTVVINFYIRGDRKGPMPNYIRKIMIDKIGRMLFVSQFIPLPPPQPPTHRKLFITPSPDRRLHQKFQVPELVGNKFMTSDYPQIQATSTSKQMNERNNRGYSQFQFMTSLKKKGQPCQQNDGHGSSSQIKHNTGQNNVQNPEICDPQDSPLMTYNGTSSIEKDVMQIAHYVKKYVGKQKDVQRKNQLTMEWRTLGLVLDRLFCIFYFSSIVIAVIIGIPTKDELLRMEEELPDTSMILI